MDLTYSVSDKQFVAAAQQFLMAHWQPADALLVGQRRAPVVATYLAALATSQRLVGHWPVAQGGLGWTPRERWLWERESASMQAPQPPAAGPDLLGPVLLSHGSARQQAQHLPGIAEGRVSWCQALGEGSGGLDIELIETTATLVHPGQPARGWTLSGTKPWVLDLPAEQATGGREDWIYVLARVRETGFGLFLVNLANDGVSIARQRMVGEPAEPPAEGRFLVGSVTFDAVALPASALLGGIDDAGSLAFVIEQAEFAHPGAVARNGVLLEQLADFVASGELDGGSLSRDEDYQTRLHELEVASASLFALKARVIAAQEAGADPAAAEFAAGANLLLATGSRDLSHRLAQLQVEALGYFALPYAGIDTLDNEGPIGPEFSQPVLFGMLSNRAREAVLAPRDHLKNIIAKSVLGLSSATDLA